MNFPFARLGALALAAATILGASAALAQATKPAPAAQPQGPIKLDLISLQAPWTKVCSKDPNGAKELCRTTRDFGQAADQPPTLLVAVDQMSGEDKRIVRFLLPVGLLLRPGFRLILDKVDPIDGKFSICFPTGCFAEAELNTAALSALKKSAIASVIVRNQGNAEVTFNVPMKDFAAAFDGPAVDPKVLEEQNQALQHQLEEKARAQREQIEKQQSGTQPTPAPAPAK